MPGLALYCPPEEARTLIILTALFLMGRVLFWVGYHYNPYVRAFGFGITFYPTVAVYLWLILYMVFGIHVRSLSVTCPAAIAARRRAARRTSARSASDCP